MSDLCAGLPTGELLSGLVSVTFRQLSPREIVDLVVLSKLEYIEWGGDVHVPPTNLKNAAEVRRITTDAGLIVACYGSYYRAGGIDRASFENVLETTVELGAPLVRVWAGGKGSIASSPDERSNVADDLRRLCDLAASAGVRVATEYHGGTLTDSLQSAVELFEAVNHPQLMTLWQPNGTYDVAARLDEIESLSRSIANVHCFYWTDTARQPLAEGKRGWTEYLAALKNLNRRIAVLLEFVKDDSVEAYLADAAELKQWLAQA